MCVFCVRMVSGPRAIFERKKICYVIVAYEFFLLLCLLRIGAVKSSVMCLVCNMSEQDWRENVII